MPRIKAVKMKPRVKNGAKTIIHHGPLSWILDMPTLTHPLLISLSNQLDRSPAAMLPMTSLILGMAWDDAPAREIKSWTFSAHPEMNCLDIWIRNHEIVVSVYI